MNKGRLLAASAVAAVTFAGAGTALAKEGPDQYPHGAENWYAGALPPPGNYFLNYLGNYRAKLKDGDGDQVRLGGREVEVDAWFDALRYVKVTNATLFGASYAMHAIVPVVHLRADFGGRASETGVGDITVSPFVLGWHHSKNMHTIFAVDFMLPTGKYDENDPRKQIGANYYSIEPVFAFSYLGDDGWEVSAKLMYNIKRRNKDTDYKSGDEFHVDYLVGKTMGPWGVGLAGYYVRQTSDDKVGGQAMPAVPGLFSEGRRGEAFAIGPSVKYVTKGGTQFIGVWQHETSVENRFRGNKVWFKTVMPF